MQFIKQDYKIDGKNLNNLLNKYGKITVKLNHQAINDDIERLKDNAEASINKVFVKNCWRIIDFLKGLKKEANNEINISFKFNGRCIESEPITIRKFEEFNIQTTDYFDIIDKAIVNLDYKKLMCGVALELGYYDLGYTLEEIEDKLKDIGIVATYSSDELNGLLEDNMYRTLYNLRIEDSDYLSPDKKYTFDYFGDKINDNKTYIGMLDSTAKKIMSIIVDDVLTIANNNKYEVELAGVYDDYLVFLVSKEYDVGKISAELAQTEVVRLFGRKFSFEPAITIY